MKPIKRILVPVDYSACARAALEQAIFFARQFGAEVNVIHVWEAPTYLVPEIMVQAPGEGRQTTLAEFASNAATQEMTRFLADLEKDDSVVIRGHVESGDPASQVIELAERDQYDLIVMGTHGRRGLSHLLLGSVAEKVVRRAACPVLTIRHKS